MTRGDIVSRHGTHNFLNNTKKWGSDIFDTLAQQAEPFTVDTRGISRRIAAMALYNAVNMNTPIIGALPDIDRTGDESINVMSDSPAATFRGIFDPPSTTGVAGGGQIPDSQRWETRAVEARVKIISMAIENDFIHDIESRLGHDSLDFDRLVSLAEQFVNRSLERDNVARAVTAGGDDYQADDFVVQLDRVIASEDEEDNATDASGNAYTTGDLSVYDVDRNATAAGEDNYLNWFDATVDHNSGTLRQLTRDLINEHIDNQVQDSSAEYENLIIITGRDTARVMSDLRDSQFRADALQTPGREQVNDAESRFGHNFNARISHWDGIPLVVAPSVPGQALSRIYVIDPTEGNTPEGTEALPKIGLEMFRTPDAWMAGPDQQTNPLATGQIAQEAAFALYPEVTARDVKAQGKVIEIEE
jgi:hypothetical protein